MKALVALLVLAAMGLGAAPAAADPVRVNVLVHRDGATDNTLSDLLAAALGERADIEVLDRQNLQRVLGELPISAVVGDGYREARLGRLLGVDVFVWVRLFDGRAALDVVDAATGRGIAAGRTPFDANHPEAGIRALANEAACVALKGPPPIDKSATTVSVATPLVPTDSTAEVQAAARSILETLVEDLQQAGVQRVHREFVHDLVLERWLMDKELTRAQRARLPLLGARFVVASSLDVTGVPRLSVALLETRTGRRAGQAEWPLAQLRTDVGRAALAEWVRRRLAPDAVAPAARHPVEAPADLPLQPEVLAPFYRGVLLHNQGLYLDAVDCFREAAHRDRRFLEPLRWMQSSLAHAGFDEVAESVADYIARGRKDPWHGISNPRALHAEPGAALVGLTVDPSLPPSLGLPATLRLIDSLHQATGAPVFVTADMARLRDEYDALVGLDNVAGTTWREAPPLLFTDTVTAHLEPAARGGLWRLRLCATRRLDPDHIATTTADLPADPLKWPQAMVAACRRLLVSRDSRPAWSPPKAWQIDPPERAALTYKTYTPVLFLKRLACDSEDVRFLRAPQSSDWFENVVMTGAHRWLLRAMPDESPLKPAITFAYVCYYERGQDYVAGLKRIEETWPGDAAAHVARLNRLLYESDNENLAPTQKTVAEAIAALQPHVPETISSRDMARLKDADRLLRRALDLPSGGTGPLKPAGPFWGLMQQGSSVRMRAGYNFPGLSTCPKEFGTDRQRAIVDVAVMGCLWRKELDISVPVVRRLLERLADQPGALTYFCVTYGSKVFSNRIGATTPEEWAELARLYPVRARATVDLLKRDPVPVDWLQVLFLVGAHSYLVNAGAEMPDFVEAREREAQAVLAAVDSGRLGKVGPNQLNGLLLTLYGRGNPKIVPYLKRRAKRSLRGDPLEDRFWRIYVQWNEWPIPAERMALYMPYYERIRQLHPEPVFTHQNQWLYYDFALTFFRGQRYDLAGGLLEALAVWESPKMTRREALKANTYYLLALLRQHERNGPEALRWAQKAMEACGEKQVGLIHSIGVGSGGTNDLNSLATDLVAALRRDPDAAPKSPFAD